MWISYNRFTHISACSQIPKKVDASNWARPAPQFRLINSIKIWNAGSFTITYLNTLTAVTKSINYKFVYKQTHSVSQSGSRFGCTHKWNSYHGFRIKWIRTEFISLPNYHENKPKPNSQSLRKTAAQQHSHA